MKKVLIATGNPGKKKEILECFSALKKEFHFLSLADLDPIKSVEEDGASFKTNALIKAHHFAQASRLPTIGEDSGIVIPALSELFGVRTRRSIEAKDDMDWLTQFLELMQEKEDRHATFFSAMAYEDPVSGETFVCEGQVSGIIVDFPQAPLEKGVPLSAVFIPEGHDLVFSAMSKTQKKTVSHRGYAGRQMCEFLKKL